MIHIRKARMEELDAVWALVREAIANMQANGNPQWNDVYPTRDLFEEAIAAQELFAACDGQETILGVAVFNQEFEDCYDELTGWQRPLPAFGIHKVAVSPKAQRMGVATALFDHAFALARELGLNSVRMDTYSLNTRMQALMTKHGFHYVGDIFFPHLDGPFYAYEKLL